MSLKVRIMHVLVRLGLDPLLRAYLRIRGEATDYLVGDRRQRFETIYREGRWTHADTNAQSLSGAGSTLEATTSIRDELPALLAELDATVLLDVGCGDFNWMRTLDLPCRYVGVDIVASVIEANQNAFSNDRRDFLLLDAVSDELPSCDVALCREVLFHLSFKEGLSVLRNLRKAGVLHLVATSDPTVRFNADIPTGAFRDVNLELSPFNLGPPLRVLRDADGLNPRRILGVWRFG